MIHRRKFLLKGSAFAASAPAIVRASSLLPALAATDGYTQGGGDIYPTGPSLRLKPGAFTTNAWLYRRLAANAPLDPNSAVYATTLRNGMIASGAAIYWEPAFPVYIVDGAVPTLPVMCGAVNPDCSVTRNFAQTDLQPDFDAVPLPNPATFVVSGGSDHEVVIYRPSTHEMWEFWLAQPHNNCTVVNSLGQEVRMWSFEWGGKEADMRANVGTWPPIPTGEPPGAAASGIPLLTCMITIEEIRRQAVNHVVGLHAPQAYLSSNTWRFPAQRTDGLAPQDGTIPEYGMIFRLPANIDLQAYAATQWDGVSPKPIWRLYAEAVRDYGCILYDAAPNAIVVGEQGDTPQYPTNPFVTDPVVSAAYVSPYHFIATDFPWDRLQLLQASTP